MILDPILMKDTWWEMFQTMKHFSPCVFHFPDSRTAPLTNLLHALVFFMRDGGLTFLDEEDALADIAAMIGDAL